MNFLYPLFLAGIAAVGLPIVLHMIRRHTRKRITFSSLMFLRTTIPRFKNRSRIENLLLLILRAVILCLLAFGFSRPFFPPEAAQSRVRLGRRIVLLIDTSASMRRAGMWDQAISEAQSVLKGARLPDRVCVMSFAASTQTLIGFEQWEALEPARRAPVAIEEISKLSPGWTLTNLGNALISAAEAIEDDEFQTNDGQQHTPAEMPGRIVLISDLQQGSDLDAMYAYEWPKETELAVKLVRPAEMPDTNAALQLLTDRSVLGGQANDSRPGIRVTNSSDATAERFKLSWADESRLSKKGPDEKSARQKGRASNKQGEAADVYVPPGHSIVVRAPAGADGSQARKLILTGDDHDFDNTLYLAPYLQQQVNILYIGSEKPNDSKGMLYYVRLAFAPLGVPGISAGRVISHPGKETIAPADIETAHLIITTDALNQENLVSLGRYLESGRTLLLVMKSIDDSKTLAGLAGIETIESEEADIDRYAMLGQIEFKHPLLMPFSEPRFGDFTKIHFWKYRRINIEDLPDARVLARFDSSDPAWFELPVGKGSLLVMTCGWHPSDSQLALSSKFVPLLYSTLEYVRRPDGSAKIQIRKPDDSIISLDAGQQAFTQTDIPGIYAIESFSPAFLPERSVAEAMESRRLFAVNLPPKECQTAAMPIEELEKFAVSLKQTSVRSGISAGASSVEPSSNVSVVHGTPPQGVPRSVPFGTYGTYGERARQIRRYDNFVRLEYEQKVWRWVFTALLAMSLIELWLAGWLNRSVRRPDGPLSNLQGEQK